MRMIYFICFNSVNKEALFRANKKIVFISWACVAVQLFLNKIIKLAQIEKIMGFIGPTIRLQSSANVKLTKACGHLVFTSWHLRNRIV